MSVTELHVVFGAGPVGQATIRELLKQEKSVRVASRSGNVPSEFVNTVETVATDGTDRAAVERAATGATHIYHCMNPLYHQWSTILPAMQANVIEAALANDALLAVSENLYMYKRGVTTITDASPIDPPTRKGAIRALLHEELKEAGRSRALRWVTVRASDYYGPGSTGQSMFGTERFLDRLSEGKKPQLFGRLDIPHTYTYVEDYGRALVVAAANPEAHGRSWIVPNSRTVTTGDFATLFCDAMSRPRTFARVPDLMLKIAGLFDPVVRELIEMLYQKNEPYFVDGGAFQNTFDFRPTTLEDGVRRTVEWYRNHSQESNQESGRS